MGFDLGMLIANFLMAYFSQPAHRGPDLEEYQQWILSVIAGCCTAFEAEFEHLWHKERTGMLYPKSLFEDQGHGSRAALKALIRDIWQDAMGFCGIEMHRRILSLAHNADFEEIKDTSIRAPLEARALLMGRDLIHQSASISSATALTAMARQYNQEKIIP